MPVLGQTRLAAIEPRDIKLLVNRLETKGISVGTVGNVIAAFKALLATAEEDGLIRSHPARSVRLPARVGEARAEAPGARRTGSPVLPRPGRVDLSSLITYTGARIGEFTELRWKDLDLTSDPAILSISRSRRGGRDTPKTKYGVRRLPLTPDLKKALAAHRLQSLWSKDDDPIFADAPQWQRPPRRGHPPSHPQASGPRRRARGCRRDTLAGLAHNSRHTCGTNLAARAGRRPEEIAAWLGHHAASFSLDTYVGRPSATNIQGVDLLATSEG